MQLTFEQYRRLVGLVEDSLDAACSRYLDSFASLNSYQDSYVSDCDIFSEDVLESLKDGVDETYAECIALLAIYNFLTHKFLSLCDIL